MGIDGSREAFEAGTEMAGDIIDVPDLDELVSSAQEALATAKENAKAQIKTMLIDEAKSLGSELIDVDALTMLAMAKFEETANSLGLNIPEQIAVLEEMSEYVSVSVDTQKETAKLVFNGLEGALAIEVQANTGGDMNIGLDTELGGLDINATADGNISDVESGQADIRITGDRVDAQAAYIDGQAAGAIDYSSDQVSAQGSYVDGKVDGNASYAGDQLNANVAYVDGEVDGNASYAGARVTADVAYVDGQVDGTATVSSERGDLEIKDDGIAMTLELSKGQTITLGTEFFERAAPQLSASYNGEHVQGLFTKQAEEFAAQMTANLNESSISGEMKILENGDLVIATINGIITIGSLRLEGAYENGLAKVGIQLNNFTLTGEADVEGGKLTAQQYIESQNETITSLHVQANTTGDVNLLIGMTRPDGTTASIRFNNHGEVAASASITVGDNSELAAEGYVKIPTSEFGGSLLFRVGNAPAYDPLRISPTDNFPGA
jgi:hypothetical protein